MLKTMKAVRHSPSGWLILNLVDSSVRDLSLVALLQASSKPGISVLIRVSTDLALVKFRIGPEKDSLNVLFDMVCTRDSHDLPSLTQSALIVFFQWDKTLKSYLLLEFNLSNALHDSFCYTKLFLFRQLPPNHTIQPLLYGNLPHETTNSNFRSFQ